MDITDETTDHMIAKLFRQLVSQGFVYQVDSDKDTYATAYSEIRKHILQILSEEVKHVNVLASGFSDGVSLDSIFNRVRRYSSLCTISKEAVLDAVNSLIADSQIVEYGIQKYVPF